eukprot:1186772-Prorocentrum_minimum.AAC.6
MSVWSPTSASSSPPACAAWSTNSSCLYSNARVTCHKHGNPPHGATQYRHVTTQYRHVVTRYRHMVTRYRHVVTRAATSQLSTATW